MRRPYVVGAVVVALVACNREDDSAGACESAAVRQIVLPPLAADPAPVIVHFARGVDLASLAASGRAGRARMIATLVRDAERAQARALSLLRAHGIVPSARLWLINALAATLPASVIDEIAQLPEVAWIESERRLYVPIASRRAGAAPAWNLAALRAPELWAAGIQGDGAVVALLDTGVDAAHPDLAPRWRAEHGWFDPYAQHAVPIDGDGHGTQVAGLVAGGAASGMPIGVAPGARWIAARIYDDSGAATLTALHLALQWTLDPDGDPATDDAADVVVGAWGFSDRAGECFLGLEPDLAALRAAQIAPVFAAGNTGPYPDSSISPANNPSAVAAGAIDAALSVIESSGRGPGACTSSVFPELVAPGMDVATADRTLGGQFPDSYVVVSGTSFAAPHVAGAFALLRGAHRDATVGAIVQALTATAVDVLPAGPDDASGYGVPDLVAAEAYLTGHPTACTDADGDGYFAEPSCGTPLDCHDGDAEIRPGACERAGDAIDQDCDGVDR